jgi:hypothetical protein
MTQRERVIDKLKKLRAMAESAERIGSEAEAQAFAAMAQEMLANHKIEMSELELETLDAEEPVMRFEIDYSQDPDFEFKKRRIEWSEKLAGIIAHAHFCQIIVHWGGNTVSLVGRRSDVEVSEFMIITLTRILRRMTNKAYADYYNKCLKEDGHPRRARGYKEGYLKGFIIRLAERYDAEKRAMTQQSTALVRLNNAASQVEDFMKELRERGETKNAHALATRDRVSRVGYFDGRSAAEKVQLRSNAVGAGDQQPIRKLGS